MDSVAQRLSTVGSANALELRGVTRLFGALAALTDISLTVRPGERRAVLGSNGAGKTTLFNCITGDFPPSSGTIRFFGEDVTVLSALRAHPPGLASDLPDLRAFPGPDRARQRVSRLSRGLARPLLVHSAASQRRARPRCRESLIQAVHLTPIKDRLVSELAYGQQRQLEIALALAGAPRFILFDEPAAGLSPTERAELIEILSSLPAHIGYIIIEHDMDVALRVVERVTMMHNGRIFKEGSPQEIEADPEVQELYLGGGHG